MESISNVVRDQLGSHAGVAPEVNLREHATHMPLPSVNKAEHTLALKPRGDITRSPKLGYQWPHKNYLCPPKILKKTYVKKIEDKETKNHKETDSEIITTFMPEIMGSLLCPVMSYMS